MANPSYYIPAVENNVEATLLGSLGASGTSVVLNSGDAAQLPTIYTGTATSAGDETTLNDTGAFASDIAVGDVIENLTDGSVAVVTEITSNDSIRTTPLEGGSNNDWGSGDEWIVNSFVVTATQFSSGAISKQERMKVVAVSSDTLTVQRGYDGDTQQAFNAEDYIYIMVEKSAIENAKKGIANLAGRIDEIYRGVPFYAVSTSSSDAYAITLPYKFASYSDITGLPITVKLDANNTGASTLNINSKGAVAIKKEDGVTALVADDLANGRVVTFVYDGTNFQLVSTTASGVSANTPETIQHKTSDYTVDTDENFYNFTNQGAGGDVDITLPTAVAGWRNRFIVEEGQTLTLIANSGDYLQNGSNTTTKIYSNTVGAVIEWLGIDDDHWVAIALSGTWTILYNASGYMTGSGVSTTVQKLTFQSETTGTGASALPAGRSVAAGASSNVKGYHCGGSNSGYQTSIYSLVFSSEATAVASGTLNTARGYFTGVQSAAKGYVAGGWTTHAVIDDIDFSDDSSDQIAATLSIGRAMATGISSELYGYIMGGFNGVTTEYNTVDKLTFSSDAISAAADTLDTAKCQGGAGYNETNGYHLGGRLDGAASPANNVIEKMVFSTEAIAAIGETLDTAVYVPSGLQSYIKASTYLCGGYNGSADVNIIQRFQWSDETIYSVSATLGTAQSNAVGLQAL